MSDRVARRKRGMDVGLWTPPRARQVAAARPAGIQKTAPASQAIQISCLRVRRPNRTLCIGCCVFAAFHEVANRRRLCIYRLGIFSGRRCAATLCRVAADRARRGRRRRRRRTGTEARMVARRGFAHRGAIAIAAAPLIAKISMVGWQGIVAAH
jgi:hypothetical protein